MYGSIHFTMTFNTIIVDDQMGARTSSSTCHALKVSTPGRNQTRSRSVSQRGKHTQKSVVSRVDDRVDLHMSDVASAVRNNVRYSNRCCWGGTRAKMLVPISHPSTY
jgi:hypothetical protein